MARNLKSKNKQLRRFDLQARGKRKMVAKRKTLQGQRLEEKQKIKFLYGTMERQFRNYVKKAQNMHGNAIENLVQLLESRLDNAVYRAGLSKTRAHARQLVSHRHILVNNKKLNIPSYQIKPGETIALEEKIRTDSAFQKMLGDREIKEVPAWIKKENNQAEILRLPNLDDPHEQADINMVFEFYR